MTRRLPCILISIDGPSLGIATAINSNMITVDTYPCILTFASSFHCIQRFTSILEALRKAVHNLEQYYRAVPHIEPIQRQYPYFNSFSYNGRLVRFEYKERVAAYSHMFIVDVEAAVGAAVRDTVELPPRLLVKFAPQYGEEAHRAMMESGIVPKLYACENLAGGWKGVAMAYVGDRFKMYFELETEDPPAVKPILERAVSKIHEMGFVHGDLRGPNILCRKAPKGMKVFIIDWDMSGRVGEVTYPLMLNPRVARHPDAKPGMRIQKEHDQYMLHNIDSVHSVPQ